MVQFVRFGTDLIPVIRLTHYLFELTELIFRESRILGGHTGADSRFEAVFFINTVVCIINGGLRTVRIAGIVNIHGFVNGLYHAIADLFPARRSLRAGHGGKKQHRCCNRNQPLA